MTNQERYLKLETYVKTKIPGFEVRLKGKKYPDDPWYRGFADAFARRLAPEYDTSFATTMYPFVYVPEGWLANWGTMYGTLRHEYIHLRDMQKYGLWFTVSYVALLPFGFTMRSHWEYRGYAQNLIRDVERYGKVSQDKIDWMKDNFTGRNYAWMDPLGADEKIMALVERAEKKEIYGLWPYEEGDFQIE